MNDSRIAVTLSVALAAGLAAGLAGCGNREWSPSPADRRGGRPEHAPAEVGCLAYLSRGGQPPPGVGYMRHRDYGARMPVHADHDRLSTFAVDVDTASYRLVRSYLAGGTLPPPEAVRTEEFVNAFDYAYASPARGELAIHLEAGPSMLADATIMLRVALQARRVHPADRRPADLTLVIDTSGSMGARGKLALVKRACGILLDTLDDRDRLSVVRYDSTASVVMRSVRADRRQAILHQIARLRPGGTTSVQAGLQAAYRQAAEDFDAERTNRVILFSDGVANTDRTDAESILRIVQRHRAKGITLTTIGVGFGNYNDVLLEQLADKGDGNYYYLDTQDQAADLLGRNFTVISELAARDVKVQVDFNPKVVRRHRLLGYENRHVADRDFRNDRVDAGEMGAGASVTALYVLELRTPPHARDGRIAKVRVRYRKPDSRRTREISRTINTGDVRSNLRSLSDATRLAAVAAYYAEWLRDGYIARRYTLDKLAAVARDVHVDVARRRQLDELRKMIADAGRLPQVGRHTETDEGQATRWWARQ